VLGVVGISATFGLITADQAASIGSVGTAATTLVSAVVTAIASFRTNKQLRNGTFDAAPEPAPAPPERNAFDALGELHNQVNSAVDQAQAKVTEGFAAIKGAAALLPGGTRVTDAVMDRPLGECSACRDRDGRRGLMIAAGELAELDQARARADQALDGDLTTFRQAAAESGEGRGQ
jgi:hypothetical protein